MAERRRGALLVFAAIAGGLLSVGGFIAFRYFEGKQLLEDAAQGGVVHLETEPFQPAWLGEKLGEHAKPFEPIVSARIVSTIRDPATRRLASVEEGPWLDRLAKIRTLQRLDLRSNSTVTDDDIVRFVATMPPDLERLELSRTNIGDRALTAIHDIQSLKELQISLTFVTERGIDKLRLSRPDMKIIADPMTRRGLGRLRRTLYPDGDRHVVHGFSIPGEMTVAEAERVGRIPNPIWIGLFRPVPTEVIETLGKQRNIQSVAIRWPLSHEQLRAFSGTRSLKKLILYPYHLDDEKCLESVCSIASLQELLLIGKQNDALIARLHEHRPDLDVNGVASERFGTRSTYRYEPKARP